MSCYYKIKYNNEMANKNNEDFFGEKKRDKSKCENILDIRLRLKLTNIEPDFRETMFINTVSAFALKKTYFCTLYL